MGSGCGVVAARAGCHWALNFNWNASFLSPACRNLQSLASNFGDAAMTVVDGWTWLWEIMVASVLLTFCIMSVFKAQALMTLCSLNTAGILPQLTPPPEPTSLFKNGIACLALVEPLIEGCVIPPFSQPVQLWLRNMYDNFQPLTLVYILCILYHAHVYVLCEETQP